MSYFNTDLDSTCRHRHFLRAYIFCLSPSPQIRRTTFHGCDFLFCTPTAGVCASAPSNPQPLARGSLLAWSFVRDPNPSVPRIFVLDGAYGFITGALSFLGLRALSDTPAATLIGGFPLRLALLLVAGMLGSVWLEANFRFVIFFSRDPRSSSRAVYSLCATHTDGLHECI